MFIKKFQLPENIRIYMILEVIVDVFEFSKFHVTALIDLKVQK